MKPHNLLLPLLLLLTACSVEEPMPHGVRPLHISFDDHPSRSSWTDLSDTEGKVSYVWENNTNMLTAIRHGDQYVPFYETQASPGQYHTDTRFETVDAAKSKIRLETLRGVKYEVVDGSSVRPVAADDAMYCCHPLNTHTAASSSPSSLYVDMALPDEFAYEDLTNSLSQLSDYAYVYTATTLKTVTDNTVIAHTSHFNSACAIIRFNITNDVTSDILITGIKMEADDGSPLFPDVLRFENGTVQEQADRTSYYSQLTTRIDHVTIPQGKKGVFYNLCFPLDNGKDFNHVPLKFTIDTNYLTYQLRLDSDVITTGHKFEAGKIYTFNFDLKEKEIRLNTIDVSLCTTYNTDNAESFNIIVSPESVWHQADSESAQMVFVSLGMSTTIGGEEYEVLWATCNLGALEPIMTGHHYAWGEVEKKVPSAYSPEGYKGTALEDISGTPHDAVRACLGNGFWLWNMPTKAMWEDIRDNCTWAWKTVKKIKDDPDSEENLDFDASVWEVTKRDGEGKITGLIYFPITGYSGLDSATGTYKKVEKAHCRYWSSTPVDNAEGAHVAGPQEQSWAFVTTYVVESSGEGNGHMSDKNDAIQPCERYNGYAIRPVLLKKKN